MKQFIVFYHADGVGKLSPAMGSDGVLIVDGRFSRERAFAAARAQAHRLRAVKPDLLAFELRSGTFLNSRSASPIHPLHSGLIDIVNACKAKGVVAW